MSKAVRRESLQPRIALASLALVWAGCVLAISFVESWVKFQAPFLSRHVAVDIGRQVADPTIERLR